MTQPAFQRIASDLRSAIAGGELPPGGQLPTEHELAERYGVSRATARQGVQLLVQDGVAVARRPLGYFVRQLLRLDWPVHDFEHGEPTDAWAQVVRAQGCEPHQQIRVEIMRPQAPIAARLGLAESDLAVVRRRTRFVNGEPYAINDSYYPESIVRGTEITDPADIVTGARHVLADLGHRWTEHDDDIEGRAPTDEEIKQLEIPPGLQVLIHTRVSANADGVRSRLMVSVLPSDRWRLRYRVRG